ncbi:MAG: hypothetical protein ABJD07_01030 [Gemmatimonadaceae bacterium]
MARAPGFDVHLVVHTHWDREWYHAAGRFRQRLVALIDELLDAPTIRGERFLLDGQTIVLGDYLAVRPERLAALALALRDGAIEAGPWFVLADELIPSGEALVRNLLAGRRDLAALGATSPPVLYSPDAFGHPAALPTLAAEFGLPLIVLWRGLGGDRWPAGDVFRWRAADGSEALVYHLPRDGYEHGSDMPAGDDAMRARWERQRPELVARARTAVLLYANGADHHARQRDLGEAMDTFARVARPDRVVPSSLSAFARAVIAASAERDVPRIAGELRDSYGYTWTLQGTLGTRAAIKRRNAIAERVLVRDAEPWAAIARLAGSCSRAPTVRAAWRALLLGHPHDTLCGCSTDEVARAASVRLDDAMAQANGIRDDAVLDLIGHPVERARERRDEWRGALVIRNRAARARGGVAEVELVRFAGAEPVGPGSVIASPAPLAALPTLGDDAALQLDGGWALEHDRTESPRHYPVNELVWRTAAVAWVDPIGAYTVAAFPMNSEARPAPEHIVRAGDSWIENAAIRVEVGAGGALRIESRRGHHAVDDVLSWHDEGDVGDLYTHSRAPGDAVHATFVGAAVVAHGPLRARLEMMWRWELPMSATRAGRAAGVVSGTLRATITLDAAAEFARIAVSGDNETRDHRLRVVVASGVCDAVVHADAMFGPVLREPIRLSDVAVAIERPPPTAPLHRYVTLSNAERGATLFSDGLAEYEVLPQGAIAVTILRAVGELSRNDLPERPGHAGWPVATPEAQSRGPWCAELALMPHGPRDDATIDRIERAADDVLIPLAGTTLRSALDLCAPSPGVVLEGQGLAFSALKESDDGKWIVARCVNLTESAVCGRWRFGAPIGEARASRLDETPAGELSINESTIAFDAPPRAVVTILVR